MQTERQPLAVHVSHHFVFAASDKKKQDEDLISLSIALQSPISNLQSSRVVREIWSFHVFKHRQQMRGLCYGAIGRD